MRPAEAEVEAEVKADAAPGGHEDEEVRRIRSAFAERDSRPPRHPAIATAYRLVNADRQARMAATVERVSGPDARILDVGCGGGQDLAHWLELGWGADRLAGVDLVPDRIERARAACPGVDLRLTSGADIPFEDGSFDVVTAVTVLSSVLDPEVRRRMFAEMIRVARPGGSVLVYDFVVRNPRNDHVVAMTARRLLELGPRPVESQRMSPLIHLVAAGALVGPLLASVAMRVAPRTHRLTRWTT
jgi:ubiquinone/menaquinone biosynthesis C-methylase UbiE